MRPAIAALVGIMIVVAAAGCGSSTAPRAPLPHSVSIEGDAAKHWTPAKITVGRGEVEISVGSSGTTHNFVLVGVAGGRSNPLFPGQTVHLHVTVHPGTYRFRCTYHPTMTGTLVVR